MCEFSLSVDYILISGDLEYECAKYMPDNGNPRSWNIGSLPYFTQTTQTTSLSATHTHQHTLIHPSTHTLTLTHTDTLRHTDGAHTNVVSYPR